MFVVKAITCSISFCAIFFAFYFDNIVDVLIQSYELSVSCLFIPVMMALFKKRASFLAACFAIVLGSFGFIIFRIYPIDFPKEIVSILLSLLGYAFGNLVAKYLTSRANVMQIN